SEAGGAGLRVLHQARPALGLWMTVAGESHPCWIKNLCIVCVHTITWDPDKNQQLPRERDMSFDDVLLALMTDQVLAISLICTPWSTSTCSTCSPSAG